MDFVALNMEHILVNMFFLKTRIFLSVLIRAFDIMLWDFLPATIGSLIDGSIFIGGLFYSSHRQSHLIVESISKAQ